MSRHSLLYITLGSLMILWAGNRALFSLLKPGTGLSFATAIAVLCYGVVLLVSGLRFAATESTTEENEGPAEES